MIAGEPAKRTVEAQRIEAADVHTRGDEGLPQRAGAERSEPVVDDVDCDARARTFGQRLGEFSADDIVAENSTSRTGSTASLHVSLEAKPGKFSAASRRRRTALPPIGSEPAARANARSASASESSGNLEESFRSGSDIPQDQNKTAPDGAICSPRHKGNSLFRSHRQHFCTLQECKVPWQEYSEMDERFRFITRCSTASVTANGSIVNLSTTGSAIAPKQVRTFQRRAANLRGPRRPTSRSQPLKGEPRKNGISIRHVRRKLTFRGIALRDLLGQHHAWLGVSSG